MPKHPKKAQSTPADALPDAPGTGVFYALAFVPALAFVLFVLGFGMFGTRVTAGLDRACAEASFVAGKQMEERGNLEQAVQLYRQALDGRFENRERLLLCQRSLGEVLLRLERPDEALEAFDEVPEDAFTTAGTYTAYVNALLHESEDERARALGEQWRNAALAEGDTQQIVWSQFAVGQAYERLGHLEDALAAYQASASLEPTGTANLLVADVLGKLNRRDEGLAHIEGLLLQLPEGRARRDAERIRATLEALPST